MSLCSSPLSAGEAAVKCSGTYCPQSANHLKCTNLLKICSWLCKSVEMGMWCPKDNFKTNDTEFNPLFPHTQKTKLWGGRQFRAWISPVIRVYDKYWMCGWPRKLRPRSAVIAGLSLLLCSQPSLCHMEASETVARITSLWKRLTETRAPYRIN